MGTALARRLSGFPPDRSTNPGGLILLPLQNNEQLVTRDDGTYGQGRRVRKKLTVGGPIYMKDLV